MCPTHDRDFKVGPRRVALIVSSHAGVSGCILFALDVGNDQGTVGENDLTIVEG